MRQDSHVKKVLASATTLIAIAGGAFAYRTVDACADFQQRYKRFLYVEMMKTSPLVYTPRMIEEIVGGRPLGCDRPSPALSHADLERFHRDPVDFDEFLPETRAAFRRTEGFKNF